MNKILQIPAQFGKRETIFSSYFQSDFSFSRQVSRVIFLKVSLTVPSCHLCQENKMSGHGANSKADNNRSAKSTDLSNNIVFHHSIKMISYEDEYVEYNISPGGLPWSRLYLLANKTLLLMLPLDLSISLTLHAQRLEQCNVWAMKPPYGGKNTQQKKNLSL